MSLASPSKPPRTPLTNKNEPSSAVTHTPSNQPNSYRLLYRGALSLPDSHITLDGLTFVAKLGSPNKHGTPSLLENPLALALESMRGRPSLRLQGEVKLADVYLDESGCIEMDIHPRALLSRIYFENIFCLVPFPANGQGSSSSGSNPPKSENGIKITLGDSDGTETTQIVVYAQLKQPNFDSEGKSNVITLKVARITRPPQKTVRLPRPDDPIPRKPPMLFARNLERTDSRGSLKDLKRVASGSISLNAGPKRPKLVGGNSLSNLGSGVRLGSSQSSGDVFKVPEVPLPKQKAKPPPKEVEKDKDKEDVFGGKQQNGVGNSSQASTVAKDADLDDFFGDELDGGAMERANKNKIKKATIAYLAQMKDPAKKDAVFDKEHPDFKEFYGAVYRGVCFAVRGRIRLEAVDERIVDKLLKMHTRMYLTGLGT